MMKALSAALVSALLISALAQKTLAQENYPATVNDGTAGTMTADHDIEKGEPAEEFLEDRLSARETELADARSQASEGRAEPKGRAAQPVAPSQPMAAPQNLTVQVAAPAAPQGPSLNELERQNIELRARLAQVEAQVAAAMIVKNSTPVAAPVAPVAVATEARLTEKEEISKQTRQKMATEQTLKSKKRYSPVPDLRIKELAERLKYANDILKRYGRAYDYRVVTLREFKEILTRLESAETDVTGDMGASEDSQIN